MEHPSATVGSLWTRFRETGDRNARDRLLLHYLPLVRAAVARLGAILPLSVDRADLMSDGIVGLIEALDRFDPTMGVRFEQYAPIRIRGAMLDGLRSLDWAPRELRATARRIDRTSGELHVRLGRRPTALEMARELGMDAEEYRDVLQRLAAASVVPLDALLPRTVEAMTTAREDVADRSLLAVAMSDLPPRHREVLRLRYREGLHFRSIGEALCVSQTRAITLHAQAIERLRRLLAEGDADEHE